MLSRIVALLSQSLCPHKQWRPAVRKNKDFLPAKVRLIPTPARVCGRCLKVEVLSIQQFYAQFGRMPW
jgi:hypothetical protein